MKKIPLTLFLVSIIFIINSSNCFSQTDSTSLKLKAARAITERFPSTRTINVEYEYVTPLDFTLKRKNDELIQKGRLKNQNRVRVDLNLPLLRLQKWVFSGSFRYRYNYFEIDNTTDFTNLSEKNTVEGNTYTAGINSTYVSKIFNKPLIYNLSVYGDFSQNGFERITGIGIASVMLKRTDKLSLTVGLAVLVDPMIRFPVLPIVALEYKITDSWTLSTAFPRYAYIRKRFSRDNRLSIGSSISGDYFYSNLGEPKRSYLYNKAEINTGLMYEHYIFDKFIFTAKGGLMNSMRGTLNKRNDRYGKYILKSSQDAGFYFNVGMSYNFFSK